MCIKEESSLAFMSLILGCQKLPYKVRHCNVQRQASSLFQVLVRKQSVAFTENWGGNLLFPFTWQSYV